MSLEVFFEEAEEVAGEDVVDVGGFVAAGGEGFGEGGDVGDGVEVHGGLFSAVAAVEIGADADVAGVAGELADVVDVFADLFEFELEVLGFGAVVGPVVDHHDGVEGHADDGAAFDEGADLVVGELAVPIGEGAAIVVAGPDGTAEAGEGVPEAFVAEVGDVEDDVEVFHLFEEFDAAGREVAFVVGAVAVDAGAIVDGTEGDEAIGAGLFEVFGGEDGVGAFEREEVADGEA